MRTAALCVTPLEMALAVLTWLGVLTMMASGGEPAAEPAAPQAKAAAPDPADGREEAERRALWNSPEMQFARAWLEEYFRTSRQSPPEVEQAYLDRLATLSAAELRQWLQQMAQTHRQIARENRRFEQARRESVASAASRQAPPQPLITRSRPRTSYNYVQPLSVQRPFSGPAYSNRYAPLQSFEIVHYLDTLQISEDLRALRDATGR